MAEKMFPIQSGRKDTPPHPTSIPWSVADKAYSVYRARYGSSQSLERLAERGGFGANEMDHLHPGWREEVSEIADLKTRLAERQAFKDWVHAYLDGKGVPHHPPGTHGAAGCRIGDRMDWVFERQAKLWTTLAAAPALAVSRFADYEQKIDDGMSPVEAEYPEVLDDVFDLARAALAALLAQSEGKS